MGRRGENQTDVSALITIEARAYLDGLIAERKRQGDKTANMTDIIHEALAAYTGKPPEFFMTRKWGQRIKKK